MATNQMDQLHIHQHHRNPHIPTFWQVRFADYLCLLADSLLRYLVVYMAGYVREGFSMSIITGNAAKYKNWINRNYEEWLSV